MSVKSVKYCPMLLTSFWLHLFFLNFSYLRSKFAAFYIFQQRYDSCLDNSKYNENSFVSLSHPDYCLNFSMFYILEFYWITMFEVKVTYMCCTPNYCNAIDWWIQNTYCPLELKLVKTNTKHYRCRGKNALIMYLSICK